MKEIFSYLDNNYPNVPLNDFEAWVQYPEHQHVYNKLYIAQKQGLDAGPIGIYPTSYPVVIKPIINLYGMSNKFTKISSKCEFLRVEKDNIGLFWEKYLSGCQYNIDINMENGKIVQYYTVKSIPDDNGMFKCHYYYPKYRLSKKIITFLCKILYNYTGFVNIEVINNYIIEIHLRLNGDLFIYSKKNIDKMMVKQRTILKKKYFYPIFVKDDVEIDDNVYEYLKNNHIIYETCNDICNNHRRKLIFTLDYPDNNHCDVIYSLIMGNSSREKANGKLL